MEHGYLKVHAHQNYEIYPVSDATVYVSAMDKNNNEVLLKVLKTDESGMTERLELEAPDKALSQKPGGIMPYALYDIKIIKDGFYKVIVKDVQIFSTLETVQHINMIPLPENPSLVNDTIEYSVLPQNL